MNDYMRESLSYFELYRKITDRKDTHSWYTAGMFLETREENKGLDKFFSLMD